MSIAQSGEVSIPQAHSGEDFSRYLPRNLSYAEDSQLDYYSVSANFVHKPLNWLGDLQFAHFQRPQSHRDIRTLIMTDMQSSAVHSAAETLREFSISVPDCSRQTSSSDTGDSEEGVFLNMLDDLDSLDSETVGVRSFCSDDFAVDSINSPDEDELLARDKVNDELSEAVAAMTNSKSADMTEKPNETEAVTEALTTSADALDEEPRQIEAVREPITRSADVTEKKKKEPIKKFYDPRDLKIAINDVPLVEAGSEKSIFDLIGTDSPVLYEDREFNFSKSELRKSRSLKTNKTPPGTPHRKKVVRFADAMGLDLESVRHILNLDSPPKIPASAMKDLQVGLGEDRKTQGSVYLAITFPQPGASYTFVRKVLDQKVCLENAVVTDLTITGFVRVANIGFHKAVRIRYTVNGWESFYDIAASYVQNSCDGPTDRFSFSIVAPANFTVGSKMEFAISYSVNDTQYWDSNGGQNYVFVCYAKTIPSEVDNSWMHFL
ncbi:glycogen-binding subunit 76A-like [Liolophura sinensis]|uniref:glycogen-binding subunit 76A-like n=1 Tax=Liolophura sinensis TaxID=3198878 RepID=UPI0031592EB5